MRDGSILHFRPHSRVVPLTDRVIFRCFTPLEPSGKALNHRIRIRRHKVRYRIPCPRQPLVAGVSILPRRQLYTMRGGLQVVVAPPHKQIADVHHQRARDGVYVYEGAGLRWRLDLQAAAGVLEEKSNRAPVRVSWHTGKSALRDRVGRYGWIM